MKGPKRLHLFLSFSLGVIVIMFVVFSALYIFVLSDIIRDIKLEEEKTRLTEQKVAQLSKLSLEFEALKQRADLIGTSLPKEKEASRLISQIEGLFCGSNPKASGCIIKTVSFGLPTALGSGAKPAPLKDPRLSQSFAKGDLALFTATISFETGFQTMYNKLKELENLSRFVHISSINLNNSINGLTINFDTYTYYQPDKIEVKDEEKKAEE